MSAQLLLLLLLLLGFCSEGGLAESLMCGSSVRLLLLLLLCMRLSAAVVALQRLSWRCSTWEVGSTVLFLRLLLGLLRQ